MLTMLTILFRHPVPGNLKGFHIRDLLIHGQPFKITVSDDGLNGKIEQVELAAG